jgi:hypothetical protein
MGRYYNGDIEGKFWFAVQNSDDADNFGAYGEDVLDDEGNETGYLSYYFETEHIPDIENGIKECLDVLGGDKARVDAFFEVDGPGYGGYNDKMLEEYLGTSNERVREVLENYARLDLGKQILECVKQNGSCGFEAEL